MRPGRTLAIAALWLGVLVLTCFVVLASALGRPDRVELIAVRTIAELGRYVGSRSTMTINGLHHSGVCSQRWDRRGHVETVRIDRMRTLRKSGNTLAQKGALAYDEFELTGCPRVVASWLSDQLNQGHLIELRTTRLDGTPVYEIRSRADRIGLTLVVRRSHGLPLALRISGIRSSGTSTVSYVLRPSARSRPLRIPIRTVVCPPWGRPGFARTPLCAARGRDDRFDAGIGPVAPARAGR